MGQWGVIVTLMLLAAVLEVAGIGTVALEIRSSRRQAKNFPGSVSSGGTSWDQIEHMGPALAEVLAVGSGSGRSLSWLSSPACASPPWPTSWPW